MADRLAEIAAREAAATEGPWTVCDNYSDVLGPDGDQLASYWNPTAEDSNGEFIAHARADVPWLLAEVRRLQGEVAELAAENAVLERGLGLNEGAAT
ncbi:hypothetical protein [Streptomyces sp. NPDC059165]|uniref:hypothetical protein n=1 Tax=Streptomyces sp. NPDC059165 TaxID=3346751 RepID=UPI0036C3F505